MKSSKIARISRKIATAKYFPMGARGYAITVTLGCMLLTRSLIDRETTKTYLFHNHVKVEQIH